MTTRAINDAGLALLKHFEGFSEEPYPDTGGIPTIGYGHTLGVSLEMPPCTEQQAETWLRQDLQTAEDCVSRFVSTTLNDNQFSALVCFTYNVGARSFRNSHLCEMLNKGDIFYIQAMDELECWVFGRNATGHEEILPGLVIRRAAERKLFLTPVLAVDNAVVPVTH